MYKKIELPQGHNKLFLLSCCAPCSGIIIKRLAESEVNFTLFFYNPNIYPYEEYLLRKEENKRYALKHSIDFLDGDYDQEEWLLRTLDLGNEPERGLRCSVCFEMRLQKTADLAFEKGFDLYSSTLGISRWKDMKQVNAGADRVCSKIPYWKYNWRSDGGVQSMYDLAKEENFYMQKYCGCRYSINGN